MLNRRNFIRAMGATGLAALAANEPASSPPPTRPKSSSPAPTP